ncbi:MULTISPECIES: protocatechuate 3,4-dioxygenase subunit alpha [Mycobacterium]|uniref:Protocatechuate 3,4-dioxygenase subunit alpha n=1 Tax=Mycobacterium paraintracellulare TaxID=1138383 RepID=A0ABM7K1R7_9MYCO|nr:MULTISPECIES: protocatechuate 3,4-dioxygenase subunit alpha [Mycobacterium]OSC22147.1 protocatechuate 3,4-dioxygenase subunit alpha [Mycobacterium paraintracellulare]WRU80780.1 protocatechuate 3,4-dioxygenase subunit alpha [Mycobacterium sp. 5-140-3-2]WSE43067.1 protocatechuate 3,4-dioxygenase subunit alpha [Mycobacterium sp. 5-140-3-1]WVL46244.1 protocatechuate 3,4-dioxygenase subunit alpha [Mycobacterium paraintracellulare]BBY67887.1 protocatechuate 3,4-dioxygenase subunit alpha [Mycobact
MTETACTPGQTVGPFLDLGLPYPGDSELVDDGHPQAIRLHGTVYDGGDAAVPDALVELWQPDTAGRIARQAGSLRRSHASIASAALAPGAAGRRHRDPSFTGWGRCATDDAGRYAFTTLTPGSVIDGRPPFFALTVFARGLLNRLFTRAYLPGADPDADPLLAAVPAERLETLLCVAENDGAAYRFDIHLQGLAETVFLAYRADAR